MFGAPCSRNAHGARTYFPSARGRNVGGYVYYHSKLAEKVHAVAHAIKARNRSHAVNYGVYGYACRLKRGGTTWSVHSWGAAIDTNSALNPMGRHRWNGRGSDGRRYRRFIPRVWIHRGFYWGIHFGDPMHFQYVEGY
jgi:hypothetical protein